MDEAIDLLEPHVEDWQLLRHLVRITEGRGRDERVLALLAGPAERFRRAEADGLREPWNALILQAEVLERSGRADEAIRLLGEDLAERRYGSQNTLVAHADLLVRHRRVGELYELAVGDRGNVFWPRYVTVLEEQGRAAEAEAFLRRPTDDPDRHSSRAAALMCLLARQGRLEEGIEAARYTFGYDADGDGNLLESALHLLADHGRPDLALALLTECGGAWLRKDPLWVRSNRWWLMGEAGRSREAVAEIEAELEAARPDTEPGEWDIDLAVLLEKDGRVEEALELLRSSVTYGAVGELTHMLVRQGRPAEAVVGHLMTAAEREALALWWGRRY